jgi:HipA-like kinase
MPILVRNFLACTSSLVELAGHRHHARMRPSVDAPLRYAAPMPTSSPAARFRTVVATRYVTPLREGGSLPALIEADDDGMYVLKFRGAGQGPRVLAAEWICGEIARLMGLPVPEIVGVEVDRGLGDAEPDEEIQDLIHASDGLNLGLDFLPGSLPYSPIAGPPPDPVFAADVVWFDGFVMNPDRSPQNPNLLEWHGRTWLIDHGAALYVHHTWRDVQEHARRPFARIREHVLLPNAGSIEEADARLAGKLDEASIREIVEQVPDLWLPRDPVIGGPSAQRRAYVTYLLRRLEAPRPFVEEAEAGRAA